MCVHFHSLNHSSTVSQLFVFWKRGSYRIIFLSHVHENEIFHGRIFYYNDILIFMKLRSEWEIVESYDIIIWCCGMICMQGIWKRFVWYTSHTESYHICTMKNKYVYEICLYRRKLILAFKYSEKSQAHIWQVPFSNERVKRNLSMLRLLPRKIHLLLLQRNYWCITSYKIHILS